jgi:antirestriction protein
MLNIFVNTWGNYNENGADGGEWLSLPMDENELDENLERIAEQMGDPDPEWAIHDYEWACEWMGFEISEYDNIHELNECIGKLNDLDEWEQKIYLAIIEIWGHDESTLDHLDNYNLYEGINNDYDLGYYWAVESGCYDLNKMGHLANYFDYESFGRDIAFETDGGFTTYGFIERC